MVVSDTLKEPQWHINVLFVFIRLGPGKKQLNLKAKKDHSHQLNSHSKQQKEK